MQCRCSIERTALRSLYRHVRAVSKVPDADHWSADRVVSPLLALPAQTQELIDGVAPCLVSGIPGSGRRGHCPAALPRLSPPTFTDPSDLAFRAGTISGNPMGILEGAAPDAEGAVQSPGSRIPGLCKGAKDGRWR
jgi:hypothetical protein